MPPIDIGLLFISLLVLLFSLTVHEAAHAIAADRLGDDTARMLGRISLNPLVHIDPLGTIVLPLLASVTGAPLLGWAKPVPVNPLRLKHYRRDFMIIAAAGPVSNLVLALCASLLFRLLGPAFLTSASPGVAEPLTVLLTRAFDLNILLAVFNLVPVPPLDRGNVLAGLLPARGAEVIDSMRPYGFFILYALLFTGVLSTIITPPYLFLRGLLAL